MKKKIVNLMVLLLLFGTFRHCTHSDHFIKKDANFRKFPKVGILTKPSQDLKPDAAQSIASDMVGISLARKHYHVIEYFARKEILTEKKIQLSGLYSGNPKEITKLTEIDALLLVSFPRYKVRHFNQAGGEVFMLRTKGKSSAKTEVSISTRFISITTGDILFSCTSDIELRGSRLWDAAKRVVKTCIDKLPEI